MIRVAAGILVAAYIALFLVVMGVLMLLDFGAEDKHNKA